MLERAHAAGVLTGWVTADEVYGQNPSFRDWLAAHQVPSVLATRNDDLLTSPDGHRRQAKTLAVLAGYSDGAAGWERRAIGPGAHGLRELRLDRRRARPGRAARRVGALAVGAPPDRARPTGQNRTGSWRSTAAPDPPRPRCGS